MFQNVKCLDIFLYINKYTYLCVCLINLKEMEKGVIKSHESYGMISISKFNSNGSQFFGSDLSHNGGIMITVSKAEKKTMLSSDWYHSQNELIRIHMTHNQFVDAITSGMNTEGVPCTLHHINGKRISQIDHIEDKRDMFSNDMKNTNTEYLNRIDEILKMLNGNIGKRKENEISHELKVLKSHIGSNTSFVMKCFNESMDKSVTEAKRTISGYIDNKIHSLGIEGLRKELKISIEKK